MTLATNSKLGPYEIKSVLGVGGMGEVYRARDSRLDRDVAIKVLRPDSALRSSGNPADLRSRFEREARAIAALNHPSIIAVYDFGIESGQQYIVSELLEGDSLRTLLKDKPLQVRRLLEVAAQVADGLAAAHAAGIIHGDLKPENIMQTKDGRAKILDFGLARQVPIKNSPAILSSSDETFVAPTKNLTSAGSILGTAAYMSPEQALGQETDYRSDQFSFGLILYEMASGKQAFTKASSVETMAAIVREELPPLEEKLPLPLRWIMERCLAKEPDQRYESTRDLYRDIKNLRDHFPEAYSNESSTTTVAPDVKRLSWILPALLTIFTLLAAALIAGLLRSPGQDLGNYRYTRLASDASSAVWSPDGKAVAYSGKVDGVGQIFLRYLNSSAPIQLTRSRESIRPLGWSSDRNHLVFAESALNSKIYSVATVGGEPDYIMDIKCEACDLSRDGKALATFLKEDDGRYGVSISDPLGSPLKKYTPEPFASKESYDAPQLVFSPDGRRLLLSRRGDNAVNELWQLPYPMGGEIPKLLHINQSAVTGSASGNWMPDNQRILISASTNSPGFHLAFASTDSKKLDWLTTGTKSEDAPVASPDGNSILFLENNDHGDVISASLENGSTKTIISTGGIEGTPSASVSGGRLAWVTNRGGRSEIWVRSADGLDRPAITAADFPSFENPFFMNPSLSPDGTRIIYVAWDGRDLRLWISSLSGGSPIRLTNAERAIEYGGAWSPDSSHFTYIKNQNDQISLMVVKTTGSATPSSIKEPVAYNMPDWSSSGEWIVYRDSKGWNMASPDGKVVKSLRQLATPYLTFARKGSLVYGIDTLRSDSGPAHAMLFSFDTQTLSRRDIKDLGSDFIPSAWVPIFRFSLSADGNSLLFSTFQYRSNLWMLTGYRQPGLMSRLRSIFSQ